MPGSPVVVPGARTCFTKSLLRYALSPLSPDPPLSVEGFQPRLIWLQLGADALSAVGTDGETVSPSVVVVVVGGRVVVVVDVVLVVVDVVLVVGGGSVVVVVVGGRVVVGVDVLLVVAS